MTLKNVIKSTRQRVSHRGSLLCLLTALAACTGPAVEVQAQSSEPVHDPLVVDNPDALPEAEFNLQMGDVVVPYDVFSLFVVPGERTELEVLYPQSEAPYVLRVDGEPVQSTGKNKWSWLAGDKPGTHTMEVVNAEGETGMTINVFVKVPAEEVSGGKLKYYHIGPYPSENEITHKDLYVEPDGFIEVTKENQDTKVSPHFTLKEFISKQRSNYPKFVYLQAPLLLKLEMLRREMNLQDINVDRMVIMSGYRTPQYNRAIGNVKFSRHVYGDAADIFVDNDGNYRMDDLNNDGEHDINDADVMAGVINELNKRSDFKALIGGLGVYGPKPHRGAFIHIDTRGIKARWRKP
ncbi:D-Ala-D-Ala carboxypeptidase family metallohydrolase [Alteromonas sp. ASW11-19]|uniref:D-Ala-D-Ala carboxypeptidase family metallohydrolase n=1 Tax=Alteromonas salexigens TaxID=2982530 RepID=A0ABT2VL94_9ALTE|nr:D-Ala-D-Ala carboxypeptidase family metallohydrolase [Alteromonas salexigens]MCU7553809.1 D-Ala-D-Ala carboxypeptidase family metallohydrolase [Alteromonas salexigens]